MGIFDSVTSRVKDFGSNGVSMTTGGGIMGGPQRTGVVSHSNKPWDDEEGTGRINIILRGLQTLLPFITLCIYIAIATFQSKWKVGPSGLTGLAIFVVLVCLIMGGLFLAVPLLNDRFTFLRGLARGFRQVRVTAILHVFQVVLLFIISLVTTISAYGGGCKNRESDPHAELEGYIDAMGPFCRNKRAAAAFFWFTLILWVITLVFVLLRWKDIRQNPKSAGFAIPGAQAEYPEDEETFNPTQTPGYGQQGTTAYGGGTDPAFDYNGGAGRPYGTNEYTGNDYYTGQPDVADMYGQPGRYDAGHAPARDPFADQQTYGEEDHDPYMAIRKSMDVHHR